MDLIKEITQKDDNKAYKKVKELIEDSKLSNKYYPYLDVFASLIDDKKSYIRIRGFVLCCSLARWDDGKIIKILPSMLKLFNDSKPTVVRQSLEAIKEVVIYCPKLKKEILKSLENIDLTRYKDTMTPLIKKDIENLKEFINKKS